MYIQVMQTTTVDKIIATATVSIFWKKKNPMPITDKISINSHVMSPLSIIPKIINKLC